MHTHMSNIKNLVFDFDGMLFDSVGYFSEKLVAENNIPADTRLFNPDLYEQCKMGQITFKVFFDNFISNVNKFSSRDYSFEELRELWFNHSTINADIWEMAQKLISRGIDCYILTDNVEDRIVYLNNKYKLSEVFKITGSYEIGKLKKDITYYQDFCEKFALTKDSVAFFDDKSDRVELLRQNGFNAMLYSNYDNFVEDIKNLGI
jgi:FMN phosphatase YigB (HAD superfamily)